VSHAPFPSAAHNNLALSLFDTASSVRITLKKASSSAAHSFCCKDSWLATAFRINSSVINSRAVQTRKFSKEISMSSEMSSNTSSPMDSMIFLHCKVEARKAAWWLLSSHLKISAFRLEKLKKPSASISPRFYRLEFMLVRKSKMWVLLCKPQ
jgi:hypothetical protein